MHHLLPLGCSPFHWSCDCSFGPFDLTSPLTPGSGSAFRHPLEPVQILYLFASTFFISPGRQRLQACVIRNNGTCTRQNSVDCAPQYLFTLHDLSSPIVYKTCHATSFPQPHTPSSILCSNFPSGMYIYQSLQHHHDLTVFQSN